LLDKDFVNLPLDSSSAKRIRNQLGKEDSFSLLLRKKTEAKVKPTSVSKVPWSWEGGVLLGSEVTIQRDNHSTLSIY